MTSSPLFLCFTYEYLAASMFSGQPATLQRLGVDEFKTQIPLFFEIKSSSHIYPIRKIVYDNPQGRTVYGHIFNAIENNEEYKLHGKGFPIVNILSDMMHMICEKYAVKSELKNESKNEIKNENSLDNQIVGTKKSIETVVFLPFDLSDKVKNRLQKFLKENCGLDLIATINLPEMSLPEEQLFVQSLGEQQLWLLFRDKNDVIEPIHLQINEAETARKIANLVVKRAKQNSSTNIDDNELEKEIQRRESEAALWIAETKQKGSCSIQIIFKDEYAAMDLLTREDIDKLSLDTTLILNKISQLDKVNSFKKIVLIGQNLDNFVLQSLLRNEFGGARVSFLQDNELIDGVCFDIFEDWLNSQKEVALKQLQAKITKLVEAQNGELTATQTEDILKEAQQYKLQATDIQRFIDSECEKIVFLSFEQLGETTLTTLIKVKHRKHGFVLMKALKEKFIQHADSKNRVKNEFEWLRGKMAHENIAKVIEYSNDENIIFYLSEWLQGTPLFQFSLPLQDHKMIRKHAIQILSALEVLHKSHWYHTRLNDKHIFIEKIDNQQVIKLTNSKIEYAGTAQIEAKQQQNIKEFGLILLQLLTAKSHAQAIAELNENNKFQYQWKSIIQRTSGASSGSPYRNVAEIIKEIEALDFEIPKPPPMKIPWKGIFAGIFVIVLLVVGFKFGKTAIGFVSEKLKSKEVKMADCQPFKQVFTGTTTKSGDGKQNLIIALNIFSVQAKDSDVCLLNYTLRIDTPDKKPYYERNQTAELFSAQKKIVFDGQLGKVNFAFENGKLVLKSENFGDLELK